MGTLVFRCLECKKLFAIEDKGQINNKCSRCGEVLEFVGKVKNA